MTMTTMTTSGCGLVLQPGPPPPGSLPTPSVPGLPWGHWAILCGREARC